MSTFDIKLAKAAADLWLAAREKQDLEEFKTLFDKLVEIVTEQALSALERIAFLPHTIAPYCTMILTVQPPFWDTEVLWLRPRALYVDQQTAKVIRVCDLKVGKNSAFRSLEPLPGIAYSHAIEQPNLPNLPDDVPKLMPQMCLSVTLQNMTGDPVRVEPWVLVEQFREDDPPPNSFEIDAAGNDSQFQKVMAMVAPIGTPFPCGGGCGKPARPGYELCATCAEAHQ